MSTDLVKEEKKTIGERFLASVIRQVASDGAVMEFTPTMKATASAYFVKIDSVLAESETKRNPQQNPLEFNWKNVNMEKLARDVAHFSKMGLNPSMKNFIHPIPYKNGKSGKLDITFIPGYEGLEYVAKKYAYDVFIDGYVQLVHENDHFKPIHKDKDNPVETYEFSVVKPFDRGEIKGGFYYQMFEDKSLNRLKFFTLDEIEKRKPKNASAEFWGGEKTVWVNGKPSGKTETIEGWYVEMLEKTLKRMCFDKVSKDPQKIDAEFMAFNAHVEQSENPIVDAFDDFQEVKIEKEPAKIEKPLTAVNEAKMETVSEVESIEFPAD